MHVAETRLFAWIGEDELKNEPGFGLKQVIVPSIGTTPIPLARLAYNNQIPPVMLALYNSMRALCDEYKNPIYLVGATYSRSLITIKNREVVKNLEDFQPATEHNKFKALSWLYVSENIVEMAVVPVPNGVFPVVVAGQKTWQVTSDEAIQKIQFYMGDSIKEAHLALFEWDETYRTIK